MILERKYNKKEKVIKYFLIKMENKEIEQKLLEINEELTKIKEILKKLIENIPLLELKKKVKTWHYFGINVKDVG